LKRIVFGTEQLSLGAAVTHQTIADDQSITTMFPALAEACSQVGSWQVRNIATIGGNLCNGAPSAETAAPLYVYEAVIKLQDASGERIIQVEDFFSGPGQTVKSDSEVMTAIAIPLPPDNSGSAYIKQGIRKAMDIAVVGVAALLEVTADGKCQKARIALGAVAPTPIRAKKAEQYLLGKVLDQHIFAEAAEIAAGEAKPITDIRASAEYRTKIIKINTRRALEMACQRARAPKGGCN
jgi:carbon-monoxide dehydrogenase medium subunit